MKEKVKERSHHQEVVVDSLGAAILSGLFIWLLLTINFTWASKAHLEKPAVQRDDINAHLQVLSLTIGPESVNGFSKVDDECLEAVGC